MPTNDRPFEPMLGYALDKDGFHNGPTDLLSMQDMRDFLLDHIETDYEIIFTDLADDCVYHVRDKCLLFPLPDGASPNNRWDSTLKKFVYIRGN